MREKRANGDQQSDDIMVFLTIPGNRNCAAEMTVAVRPQRHRTAIEL